MRLDLSIHDERMERENQYSSLKPVDFERLRINDAILDARVMAGVLRSIADDLAPEGDGKGRRS
jgi:hypothetical protein